MFAMTSHGAKVDYAVMKGRGPYTFRMHGQNYHAIGSLLPAEGLSPKYAQLYIYDAEHEIENRLNSFGDKEDLSLPNKQIDKSIVKAIKGMFDKNNRFVKQFRKAQDWYQCNKKNTFRLKLIENRQVNSRNYTRPTCSDIAALMAGDGLEEGDRWDMLFGTEREVCKGLMKLCNAPKNPLARRAWCGSLE